MPTAVVQTTIRLPADVYKNVEAAAKRQGKSINEWFVDLAKASTGKEKP